MQQLMWIETLFKLSGGLVLLLTPILAVRLLGLPPPDNALWPRLTGALLLGMGIATALEGRFSYEKGLGLGGVLLINLVAVFVLGAMLVLGKAAQTRRGRWVLWSVVWLLLLLSLFEIAHV